MLVTHQKRFTFLRLLFLLGLLSVTLRLGFWQIVQKDSLQAAAQQQYQRKTSQAGHRGTIYSADGYLLVGNQPVYRVFAEPQLLNLPAQQIAPLLASTVSSDSATVANLTASLSARLSAADSKWVALLPKVSEDTKNTIQSLDIKGIGFDQYSQRWYPEASLAAHTLGFVGKDVNGQDIGYFGIEGALERELGPKSRHNILEKDALGYHLLGSTLSLQELDGRDVSLTIRRDLQFTVEKHLKNAMEKYGAKAAEVIIMEPETGKILASAAYPNYDPSAFYEYPKEYYKHPSFSAGYEPGSTMKTLTVSAGIDAKKITPDTTCPVCSSAREVSGYTIKTWNNQYHPDITMTEALAKSDNTAMMYITDLLGKDTFVEYLQRFGLGTKSYAEVQEDTSPPFPTKWGPVELATGSFGQGISVTSIQLLKAVNAIANQGKVMRPQLVESVFDPTTGQKIITEPVVERQAISPETAATVTKMMVNAAEAGEAQWIAAKTTHTVAAKTGTSQVAENGAYNPEKTIATFIGFAPADKPRFIMLVKLVEPQSSIWAAETAAPLWYKIANDVYLLLQIPPDKPISPPKPVE